jgi:hypothetical protein
VKTGLTGNASHMPEKSASIAWSSFRTAGLTQPKQEKIMTQDQKHIEKYAFRNVIDNLISGYHDVVEGLSHKSVHFGGHPRAKHAATFDRIEKNKRDQEYSENRYSVLYTREGRYQHLGCSTEAEAQTLQGMLMTDGERVPVGIYDSLIDQIEWEIVGAYFHAQDPAEVQQARLDEVLIIARAIRRRDSSWQPGYLQKPGFFA